MTKPDAAAGFEFIIKRTFNAPLDRLWRAWTEPERFARWWGPKGFECEIAKLDLRPGGICHYRLESTDRQVMWGKLVYREIEPQKRLVFIVSFSDPQEAITIHPLNPGWPRQIHSTVTFSERDGKTTVTIRWVPHEATDSERDVFEAGKESMQQGWSGTLDRLDDFLGKAGSTKARSST
jgi:uncharacterized protein YndB with AHSA1/START domain